MVVKQENLSVSGGRTTVARQVMGDLLSWPYSAWIFLIGAGLLYAPVVAEVARLWFTDENYSHGVFIFPIALFLVWIEKERIRQAPAQPVAWGLALLTLGLVVEISSYLLRLRYWGMWSLIPVLAGGILLLHGRHLWKLTRFPVFFLLFAAPVPNLLLKLPSQWIQGVSAVGSAFVMQMLGYPIMRSGNIIELPGNALEVADACSGFKKLVALIAFALLYGYLCSASPGKRLLLVLAAIPIAVFANIIRISGLIAVTWSFGSHAMHLMHDWAELIALGIAFVMFLGVGNRLQCKITKLSS